MLKRKAAYLQIIRKCNSKCIFCSNPQFEKEITFAEAKSEINKLHKQKITEIILTGGEPAISKNLFIIIDYLKKKNMQVRLISNGVKFSDMAFTKKLKKTGISNLHISLQTFNDKIADKLSQKKGNLHRTLLGIKNALACGFNVNINTTINALNYKQLPEFIETMDLVFSDINHFVFNFLDPGMSDGNIKSRASENPAVVAKYADIVGPLKKMVRILKKRGKTFRIERVPLCCMPGFEEYSTETRKIVKDELYICSFVEKNNKNRIRTVKPGLLRTKVAACKKCSLDSICAGVQEEYLNIHGGDDLKPVKRSVPEIFKKINNVS